MIVLRYVKLNKNNFYVVIYIEYKKEVNPLINFFFIFRGFVYIDNHCALVSPVMFTPITPPINAAKVYPRW